MVKICWSDISAISHKTAAKAEGACMNQAQVHRTILSSGPQWLFCNTLETEKKLVAEHGWQISSPILLKEKNA